jgi:WG containing repeat
MDSELPATELRLNKSSKVRKIVITSFISLILITGLTVGVVVSKNSVGANNVNEFSVYHPKGDLVIPAQFDGVLGFSGGMSGYSTVPSGAPLVTQSKPGDPLGLIPSAAYGFVSRNGLILSPNYYLVGEFVDGYAPAGLDKNHWGIIDKHGNWVIPAKYNYLGNYGSKLFPFTTPANKVGFLNLQGKVVIPPQWDSAGSFIESRASVCNQMNQKANVCGFIDPTGKITTPLIYNYTENFDHGIAMVCKGLEANQKCGYIDPNGKILINISSGSHQEDFGTWFPDTSSFTNGLAAYGGRYFDGVEKWGFISPNAKFSIPITISRELPSTSENSNFGQTADDPWPFDVNIQWEVVGATKDTPGHPAAMDKKGNIKFLSSYDEVRPFSQGISAVRMGKKWGFINEKNEMVIKPQYDWVRDFSEGLAAVQINGKWGFID